MPTLKYITDEELFTRLSPIKIEISPEAQGRGGGDPPTPSRKYRVAYELLLPEAYGYWRRLDWTT